MTKTLTIAGVDQTSVWRWINNGAGDSTFEHSANRGQVGSGYVIVDDSSAALTIAGMKSASLDESAESVPRVWTGFTDRRAIKRGPFKAGTGRQWKVELVDVNARWDDQILLGSDSANRPAETDYARMSWLIASGVIGGGASAGTTVPSGSNVNMDATDYRGQHPRDVAEDCAQKSGKNYFLYYTDALYVFYALASGTTFSSTLKISDDPADVDGSTVFAPIISDESLSRDPARVYSGVRLRYKSGAVYVRNATTASNFRTHEAAITHMRVKTSTKATEQAQKWLDQAANETDTLPEIGILVPLANVNDVLAGQRVQIKLRHASVSSFTYYRVQSRVVIPTSDDYYLVRLTFLDDVRPTRFNGGQYVDEQQSNATDTDATVVIDENGITVTNGTITVTSDTGATVTFDGTQQTFQVVATGVVGIRANTHKTAIVSAVRIKNTGLTYDPGTIWFSNIQSTYRPGEWRQILPYIEFGHNSGFLLHKLDGMARRVSGTTHVDVQLVSETSSPPFPSQTARYYVVSKQV